MHRTALAVAAALLLAAGCNNGGGGPGPTPSGSSSSEPAASTPPQNQPPAPAPSPSPPPAPPPPRYAHEWYVAKTGSDGASGTGTAPFKTISRAIAAAGPGDRITVRAGTYAERIEVSASTARAGTADAPILLQGDGRPRIVPGGTEMSMVDVSRPHWVIDGFEVDAQGQNKIGVSFFGSTEGSTLRASLVHAGSGPAAVATSAGASGVVIDNVDIHHFWRDGVDSHGVAVEPGSQRITVRGSRIHDVSGDSVQCIGPEGESSLPPADGLLIEDNDFSANRENALDIKTCKRVVARRNVMHDFLQQSLPGGCAVVIHMSADDVLIEDNEIYRVGLAISLGGNHTGPVPQRVRIQRNRIHDVQAGTELGGVGISIQNSSGAKVVGNAFARIATTAIELGYGTGGATDSLRIADNLIDADFALKVGAYAPGLSVGPNGFRPSATFRYRGLDYDYTGWRALGFGARTWLSNAMFASLDTLAPAPGAVDQGSDEGLPFCGTAPDLGAIETGC